ncbi:cytochrome c oxidase assembly protein [Sphingosinicellaceae bacterium]|nr:cytochrome c oxidase assembly protein [Sphingosinicellaceae bacterium]
MSLAAAKRQTAIGTAAIATGMIALSFAAVPLYRAFCQATGFAGTTQRAEASALPNQTALTGRTIKIRFDANTSAGMPWQFAPEVTDVPVKIGERKLAFFKATNISAAPVTGRATYNVSPDVAGKYFKKIQCFCFNEQTLKAGETVEMPVTYFVDPAILDDPIAKRIDEITLSYTFYPVDERDRTQVESNSKTQG